MNAVPGLKQLEYVDEFVSRHIGPSTAEISTMLEALGVSSLDELINKIVPEDILSHAR